MDGMNVNQPTEWIIVEDLLWLPLCMMIENEINAFNRSLYCMLWLYLVESLFYISIKNPVRWNDLFILLLWFNNFIEITLLQNVTKTIH